MWNRLLQFPLERLHARWSARGEVPLSWFADLDTPLLVWADNLWLLSSDEAGLSRRVHDVLQVFGALRLPFSDSSLELLSSPAAPRTASPWMVAGREFRVQSVLQVLGVALDATASTAAMLGHRTRAAEGAWQRHRSALTDSAISPVARWRRWHATVGASAAWGSALWHPTADTRRRVDALETRHLRKVLRQYRQLDEDWLVFFRRRRRAERDLRAAAQQPPLYSRALSSIHRWAGHAARSGLPFLAASLRFRDTAAWRVRQFIGSTPGAALDRGWRHPSRNWRRDVDHALSLWRGVDWKQEAMRRQEWAASERDWADWARAASGAVAEPDHREPPPAEEAGREDGRQVRPRY